MEYEFPVGLLPKGAIGYSLNRDSGEFAVYFQGACSFDIESYTRESHFKWFCLQSLVVNEYFQHILRVLNTNVDGKQKIMFALTSIKGIGRQFTNICSKIANVDMNKRFGFMKPLFLLQGWGWYTLDCLSSKVSTPSIPPTPRTEGEILKSSNMKSFNFSELKTATRNFRPDSVVGEGRFGCVFKGWIDELLIFKNNCGLVEHCRIHINFFIYSGVKRRQVPTPSRPSRSLGNNITRVVRHGAESVGVDANGNSFDITTKLLHLACHPAENSIACAGADSLKVKGLKGRVKGLGFRDILFNSTGNIVQPKWGHLNELHGALKPMEEALTSGNVSETDLGNSVKVWLKLICKAVKEIDESQIFHNLEAQHRYLTWRAEKVVHTCLAWSSYEMCDLLRSFTESV
ncbi:hypothetical protein JHK82_018878 [Glycine max]|nr:hypothetical protein JHK82_018878 [Glycine max]